MPMVNGQFVPPQNWAEIEDAFGGNAADWIYAIQAALHERSNVGANFFGDFVRDYPILNSWMFFDFAIKVEEAIMNAVAPSGFYRQYNENGTLAGSYIWNNEKMSGWLNPSAPVVISLKDTESNPQYRNLWSEPKYNFLTGKDLLEINGCNFREPLTQGYSSLETCFPIWFERVKNAINQLHVVPVEVYYWYKTYRGNGYSNNSADHASGETVDARAWDDAVADYSTSDTLPDGDQDGAPNWDWHEWVISNRSKGHHTAWQESWGVYHRTSYDLEGGQLYVKRLRSRFPNIGMHVYSGWLSGVYGDTQESYASNYPKNTIMTMDLGTISRNDNMRWIGGGGWTLFLNDTDKFKPDYSAPQPDPSTPGQSADTDTVKGHVSDGLFYADFSVADGFKFQTEE